jgi:serine/threonine protein kinase
MIVEKIGEGKYGKVYKGCYNKMCRYKYAAKESDSNLTTEYRIGLTVSKVAPGGVVRPYGLYMGVLFTRYIPLYSLTTKNFTKVLKKILKTLMTIQKTYPSFRHNDLSFNNVFIDRNDNAFIGDFGLANIERQGLKNPLIQSDAFKNKYGIYPNNNPKFDIHFFLNSIYVNGPKALRPLVNKYLPPEYRGITTPKVSMGRLRGGVTHTDFPSMKQLFSMVNTNEQKRRNNLRKGTGERSTRS